MEQVFTKIKPIYIPILQFLQKNMLGKTSSNPS